MGDGPRFLNDILKDDGINSILDINSQAFAMV